MGSKLIGFRVPDDLAEQLEQAAAESGNSTSEYLRKLVDNDLYPSKQEQDSPLDRLRRGGKSDQLGELESSQSRLEELGSNQSLFADEIKGLAERVNELADHVELARIERGAYKDDKEEASQNYAELAGAVNRNAAAIRQMAPIVEVKLKEVNDDLDLVYQALDNHGHKILDQLNLAGGPLSFLGDKQIKLLNERIELAKRRRSTGKG